MKDVINFLKKLKKNNNREWFNAHKIEYLAAREEFTQFVEKLIASVSEFDSSVAGVNAQKAVFRIYRDIRFSKDKSPYKTNFGAAINASGKSISSPVYYVNIEPGDNFIGCGVYMPQAMQLLSIRNAIVKNSEEFLRIVNAKSFTEVFGKLEGERVKTAPKGFSRDHEMIDYLRLKSFVVINREISESDVEAKNFVAKTAKMFKLAYPLIAFLRNTS
ncbi:MAG: DUF2461 domain-containing protein [Pyrinomonadaceae bacterium]